MPSTKSSSGVRVPLLDLTAQNGPLRDETLAAMARVVDSQRFIGGPEIDSLERELAAMIGAKHAIGVSSGTDALLVTMMALGIGPGDEVLVDEDHHHTRWAHAGPIGSGAIGDSQDASS